MTDVNDSGSVGQPTTRSILSQFQRNVLFIAITCFVLGMTAALIIHTTHQNELRIAEQKVQWKKANIKALKDLSVIGALSTEEQTRVDNAGDDLDRLQQVLLDIHQERLNYWVNQAEELHESNKDIERTRTNLLSQVGYVDPEVQAKLGEWKDAYDTKMAKCRTNIIGYREAKEKIHQWKSISFEDFQSGKKIMSGSLPKSGPATN
jgi:hypothetical protein